MIRTLDSGYLLKNCLTVVPVVPIDGQLFRLGRKYAYACAWQRPDVIYMRRYRALIERNEYRIR